MKKRDLELQEEVRRRLAAAEAADAAEDAEFGPDKLGDELPDWVADKEKRIAKIRAAQAELDAEAKAFADEERRRCAEADAKRLPQGRKPTGKEPAPVTDAPVTDAPVTDAPDAKAQKNFTDPESRIMMSKDGYVQAYIFAGTPPACLVAVCRPQSEAATSGPNSRRHGNKNDQAMTEGTLVATEGVVRRTSLPAEQCALTRNATSLSPQVRPSPEFGARMKLVVKAKANRVPVAWHCTARDECPGSSPADVA